MTLPWYRGVSLSGPCDVWTTSDWRLGAIAPKAPGKLTRTEVSKSFFSFIENDRLEYLSPALYLMNNSAGVSASLTLLSNAGDAGGWRKSFRGFWTSLLFNAVSENPVDEVVDHL